MRMGARICGLAPTGVGALQRRLGSLKVADELAARASATSASAPEPLRARRIGRRALASGSSMSSSRSSATRTIRRLLALCAAE